MMPTPQEIVAGLSRSANDAISVAIAWHLVTLLVLVALLGGWRPTRRRAAALLTAPLASVSLVAFYFHNPFNGIAFALLTFVLLAISSRLDSQRVEGGHPLGAALGIAMILFGWLYPHFLESRPLSTYLIAAPAGVVPCPTLALVTGFALLANGFGSPAWSVTLAMAGLLYALFGFARLGVWLDVGLGWGAAWLLLLSLRQGLGGSPHRGSRQRGEAPFGIEHPP